MSAAPADVTVLLVAGDGPGLARAAQSVFAQDFAGRVGLVVAAAADRDLDGVLADCPRGIPVTRVDPAAGPPPGLSGSLATLGDRDWWGRDHLTALCAALEEGGRWAAARRWLVEPATGWPICPDPWPLQPAHPAALMLRVPAGDPVTDLWWHAALDPAGPAAAALGHALQQEGAGRDAGHFTAFTRVDPGFLAGETCVREFLTRGLRWPIDPAVLADLQGRLAGAQAASAAADWPAARAAADAALALNPQSVDALRVKATALWKLGRAEDAAALLDRALVLDDLDEGLLDLQVSVLHAAGGTARAMGALGEAQRRLPRSALLREALVRLLRPPG